MPQIVANPPLPSCYHLYPGPGIQQAQALSPDPFPLHTRGRFAKGNSGSHLPQRRPAKTP
jgi:hypothetical protein